MSHPVPGHEYTYQCSLCSKIATDGMTVEAGNNAEVKVFLNLCDDHLDEHEKDEMKFLKKYAEKFDELAAEKSIGGEL